MTLFRTLKRININYVNAKKQLTLAIITNKNNIEPSFIEKIDKYIKKNLLTNVVWIDPIPYKNIYNYLQIADVIIAPNKKSRFNELEPLTKIFINMGSAIPTVCANLAGNRTLINNRKEGYLIEPENADKYSEAIMEILNDKQKAIEVGLNAKKKIQDYHNPNLVVKKINQIYYSLMKN